MLTIARSLDCATLAMLCCILLLLADGRKEKVMFDKITSRISKLCYGLKEDYVDPVRRGNLTKLGLF